LAQERLESSLMSRFEFLYPVGRFEQRFLNQILGIQAATNVGWKPAVSPSHQTASISLTQRVKGVAIACLGTQQQDK
jgi:hypothetical protein